MPNLVFALFFILVAISPFTVWAKKNAADSLKNAALKNYTQRLQALDTAQHKTPNPVWKLQMDSIRNNVKGYPVSLYYDTLFYVYAPFGPLTALERARLTTEKLKQLAADPDFSPDSIQVFPLEQTLNLHYKDLTLLTLTHLDELWLDKPAAEIAQRYKAAIQRGVQHYREQTSFQALSINLGKAAAIILGLFLAVLFIGKFFDWVRLKVNSMQLLFVRSLKIYNYELLTRQRLIDAMVLLLTVFRVALVLLCVYLTLPLLFSVFPQTRHIAHSILNYILDPLKEIARSFWNYLPNLFTILVIVFVFRLALKAVRFFKLEIERKRLNIPGFYPDWANPTYQIIRTLVFAFALVVIFPYLPGSNSPIFQGVSVFLGFLLTFGSSGPLSNMIAGLALTYMRAYRVGQRVQFGEVSGVIVEKNLLVTRLRTPKNEEITIPNANILNGHTINYSSAAESVGLVLHTTVTIGYDVPWRQVHDLLIKAALVTPEILAEPFPFVLQTSLDDFYVAYQINAYTRQAVTKEQVYSALHQNIQDQFNEAGVEIMSPHYATLRDGSATTIPTDYLPKNYTPPPFRVQRVD